MKSVSLIQLGGEFCTQRDNPGIVLLKAEIERALLAKNAIAIDRTGVRIVSVSFIDELLADLAVKYSVDQIEAYVQFRPPLEPFLKDQIARGSRLRTIRS